jgi:hypothetical protein
MFKKFPSLTIHDQRLIRVCLTLLLVVFPLAIAHAIQIINNSSKAISVKVNGYEAELKGGSIADLPSKVKPPYEMTLIRQNNKGEVLSVSMALLKREYGNIHE